VIRTVFQNTGQAPATCQLTGPNFTPPFPAYPSGQAGIGGAIFQIMRRFYGTDNVVFTFVSDEFNGVTATTMEMSVPISRAVSRLYHGPRKRMARAGFISASTGASIRRKGSPWVTAWATTCSTTPSRRFAQDKSTSGQS
jgi:hypothetical protein